MKQQINLYNYLPRKTGFYLTRRTVLKSYGVFLLLLLIFYGVSLWQKHKLIIQVEQLNKTVAADQQQLTILTQKYPVSDLANLKIVIQHLQDEDASKASVIDLLSPYANFSAYLKGLGNAIVPGVWLTQININREGNKLALKGYTIHPTLLEQFYTKLARQPMFYNLTFKVAEIKQTGFPASFYITATKANKA